MGYFLIRGEYKCVPPEECPSGTQPDISTRICQLCHFVCQTCVGPNADQCIICKFTLGFVKDSKQFVSGCLKLYCSAKYFESILTNGEHVCALCHNTCRLCNGPLASHCLECHSHRISYINTTGSYCVTCGDLHPGY